VEAHPLASLAAALTTVVAVMGILIGGFYLKLVIGDGVPPSFAAVPFVLGTIVVSIAAQIVLAVMSPREASIRWNSQDMWSTAPSMRAHLAANDGG